MFERLTTQHRELWQQAKARAGLKGDVLVAGVGGDKARTPHVCVLSVRQLKHMLHRVQNRGLLGKIPHLEQVVVFGGTNDLVC